MPDFPVISPGLITCCRPRLSLTSLPRPCPGYYRSLLSLTTSLITCCRPRLSLTSLPRLCPGYYRSLLSLTTSSPISSWLLTCSAPWLHSSSRLPVLHLGPHHTRDRSRVTGRKVPQTRLQTNEPECSQTQIKLNQGSVLLRPYNVWTKRTLICIGTRAEHLKLVMLVVIEILEWQQNQLNEWNSGSQPSQVVFCLIFTGTRGDPEETSDYVNENPHSASGTNINNWLLSYWLMCIWNKPQLKLHHIIIK